MRFADRCWRQSICSGLRGDRTTAYVTTPKNDYRHEECNKVLLTEHTVDMPAIFQRKTTALIVVLQQSWPAACIRRLAYSKKASNSCSTAVELNSHDLGGHFLDKCILVRLYVLTAHGGPNASIGLHVRSSTQHRNNNPRAARHPFPGQTFLWCLRPNTGNQYRAEAVCSCL